MASTQWSGAKTFFSALPSWLGPLDAERIAAYQLYEDIYWSQPDSFKLVMRGTNAAPIYIPAARIVIEATNRFLAKDWDYVINPRVGTPESNELFRAMLEKLFKRELLYTKFGTQKRYGLIRGDAVWHVVADPLKAEGSRISVHEVDPASYFPIYEDDDLDRRIGVHLVDQIEYDKKTVIRRQTYRKDPETGTITTELALFEAGKWDDREGGELKLVKQLVPTTPLPPIITSIPVYHIQNMRTPASPFGSSELRGFETLMTSVNQTVSDQELAIALDGIGVYATTSGPPVDEDGNETNWVLGPGRVVEIDADSEFNRVSGVSSLPGLEHIKFVMDTMFQGAGVPAIAAGNVDVQVAESGIALYLQLAPLLAKNAEKEQEMLGVYDHMLYDLTHMWFPAYESLSAEAIEVASVIGDPMPVNRQERIDELLKLLAAGVITAEYTREKLGEMGYDFPENMGESVVAETAALANARVDDPFKNRVNEELEGV